MPQSVKFRLGGDPPFLKGAMLTCLVACSMLVFLALVAGFDPFFEVLLLGAAMLFVVFLLHEAKKFTTRQRVLVVSSDSVKVNEGNYDPRQLVRIEVFRVTPPQTDGDYAIIFIFEREGRPRRVPLFVTGKELKEIILGIKPLLGDVRISIRIRQAMPVKLVF